MPVSVMPDCYAEVDHIIEKLVTEGLVAEATVLRNAVDAGSTGTEILMSLRHALEKIDKDAAASSLTRRKIRGLVSKLNKALS